jgi:hypothetical protein
VDATDPTAIRAITPVPIQRSHRDSNTVELLRRDRLWREEGEAAMVASGAYQALIWTSGVRRDWPVVGLCYARQDNLCHAAWSRSR